MFFFPGAWHVLRKKIIWCHVHTTLYHKELYFKINFFQILQQILKRFCLYILQAGVLLRITYAWTTWHETSNILPSDFLEFTKNILNFKNIEMKNKVHIHVCFSVLEMKLDNLTKRLLLPNSLKVFTIHNFQVRQFHLLKSKDRSNYNFSYFYFLKNW